MHPLEGHTNLDDILGIFKRCRTSKKKPNLTHALRSSMLAELGHPLPDKEYGAEPEPLLILGYGVNAFFDIQWALMMMFVVMSIFSLPLFFAYSANGTNGL